MRKDRAYRAVLPVAPAILLALLTAGCATTSDDHAFPLLHRCKPEAPRDLTLTVTGLVKQPGVMIIPPGGLQLRDAVTLAGGDMPAQRFDGLNPAQVLVSLDRPTGKYLFSLPLVTHDVAGRIYLQPGDRVRVEPASETILARSMLGRSDTTDDRAMWRAILKRDDVDGRTFAYDVPFVEQNETVGSVTVTVGGGPALPRAGQHADAMAAPAAVGFTVMGDFSQLPPSPYFRTANLNRAATPPNLLNFTYAGQSDPEATVLVLNRLLPGENYFCVLLRPESYATGADRAAVQDLLGKVTVLPGDAVAIGALVQLPIVLNSMVGAQLFDYAAPEERKHHMPGASVLAGPLEPIVSPVKAVCVQLQAIPGAISSRLPW